MSQDPFDQRLREELHDFLDHAHPSATLRPRTEQKLGRRRRVPPPRTMLVVAGAVAALLFAVVGAGALTKGPERKTHVAARPPAPTPTQVPDTVPFTSVPTTAVSSKGASTPAPVRRTSTTIARPTTTLAPPPPTLPAYNPPKSASSTSPAGSQGCASLVITVATDHSVYAKGSPVGITVTLSNPSSAPCSSACPPSYWAQGVIAGRDQNGFQAHGAMGCGGALAAHSSFSEHYVWCQVMGQQSEPSNSCRTEPPPDASSGTYQVQAYVNFTTEGDQLAGSFDIAIQ